MLNVENGSAQPSSLERKVKWLRERVVSAGKLREFGNILLTPLIKWSLVSSSDFNVGHEKEKQLGLKHMNFISSVGHCVKKHISKYEKLICCTPFLKMRGEVGWSECQSGHPEETET